MAKQIETKVITNPVRLSYVHVVEPQAFEGQKAKYGCTLLIPKEDTETLEAIEKAIDAAYRNDDGNKLKNVKRENVKTTLRDGDEKADENPEYAGHMFINVSSERQPQVLNTKRQHVLGLDNPEEEIYSGVYAHASINFFAFNFQGNKGISAGLNNLLVLGYGDRLAGAASAETDFEDFDFEEDEDFDDLI